jgi:integrase
MTNVMAGLRRPKQTRAEKLATEERKARALSDAEIIAVWNACEGRGSFGNLVRLLLLAGARRGEIAKLARDQVQSDRLVLPLLSTKTGERHEVPLTELMRTIIVAQPTILSALVFPLEVTGRPILGWTKLVAGLQDASGVDFPCTTSAGPAAR